MAESTSSTKLEFKSRLRNCWTTLLDHIELFRIRRISISSNPLSVGQNARTINNGFFCVEPYIITLRLREIEYCSMCDYELIRRRYTSSLEPTPSLAEEQIPKHIVRRRQLPSNYKFQLEDKFNKEIRTISRRWELFRVALELCHHTMIILCLEEMNVKDDPFYLKLACIRCDPIVVRWLLEDGADPSDRRHEGQSAAQLARSLRRIAFRRYRPFFDEMIKAIEEFENKS